MNLEQALKQASYKVWNELEPCANPNYKIHPVREEALTSMGIRAISDSNCVSIEKIEMISADKEITDGYDFEFIVGNNLNWIRFFIQGKRLYGNTTKDSYSAIKKEQISDLISYSKTNIGIPIYALYNHLLENDIVLSDYYNSVTPYDRKSLGITLMSAYSIEFLQTKKFHEYHFNGGQRISPALYSLKAYEHLFYFYDHYRKHLSVPFHEISYLTIELAEIINKLYRKRQAKSKLPFFFFFFPGMENLAGDDGDLIPIIRKTSKDQLIKDFRKRATEKTDQSFNFQPRILTIINTNA